MILCFCMVISPLSGITVPAAAESLIPSGAFGSGQDGSFEAPYQITGTGQFQYLDSSYGTHYFILKSDLNFAGGTTGVSELTSYLEGGGHTISN